MGREKLLTTSNRCKNPRMQQSGCSPQDRLVYDGPLLSTSVWITNVIPNHISAMKFHWNWKLISTAKMSFYYFFYFFFICCVNIHKCYQYDQLYFELFSDEVHMIFDVGIKNKNFKLYHGPLLPVSFSKRESH